MKNVGRRHNPYPEERRRRDLAMIHLAKKQLELDDTYYRRCLLEVTGKESAAELDERERGRLIGWFMLRGFRLAHASAKKSSMHKPPACERAPVLNKIGAILAELELPWAYADGIARQMFKVNRVRWLFPDQLQAVLVALIKLQEKEVPYGR